MVTVRVATGVGLALASLLLPSASAPATPRAELRVLVFTKTTGFRHDSIPNAVRALRELGGRNRLQVDHTEDARRFSDAGLRAYDVVVFALTTGDVLDVEQQAAFQRYVRAGGGFAGIHSASDTEHDWPWYGALVGAYFRSHPAIQLATVEIREPRHPSTRRLPRVWRRTDEWYNFAANPRPAVQVLASLDETSYVPGPDAMGDDHPTAWSHAFEGGRAWYTGGGHTKESYAEALFLEHVLGGILWAAGPPRIVSLRGVAAQRRLVVAGRRTACVRCRAELRVFAAGRVRLTRLRADGGAIRGRSGALPPGRWRYTVVLEDAGGQRTMLQRRITVR